MGNCCSNREPKTEKLYDVLQRDEPQIRAKIKAEVEKYTNSGQQPLKYEDYDQIVQHVFGENQTSLPVQKDIREHYQRGVSDLKGKETPDGYTEIIYKLLKQAGEKQRREAGPDKPAERGGTPPNFQQVGLA